MANPMQYPHLFRAQSEYVDNVGLNEATHIRLHFPTVLRDVVIPILEEHWLHPDDPDPSNDADTHVTIVVTDDNAWELQETLVKKGIPHNFQLDNYSHQYERASYRYINGVYSSLVSDDSSDKLSTSVVSRCLEEQAYTALAIKAREAYIRSCPWDFTAEDYTVANKIAFKHVCEV